MARYAVDVGGRGLRAAVAAVRRAAGAAAAAGRAQMESAGSLCGSYRLGRAVLLHSIPLARWNSG